MDCHDYITNLPECKRGQHLQREERGAIQALKGQKLSIRAIAKILGYSPPTVGNELKRGTAPRKSSRGRAPGYNAKQGESSTEQTEADPGSLTRRSPAPRSSPG